MTAAPRLAVYGAPPILAALDAVSAGTDGEQSRTARLATVCERYLTIVREHCPLLTLPQWGAVLDVRNGARLLEEAGSGIGPDTIAAELDDLRREDPLWQARHPELTPQALDDLVSMLLTADPAARTAVVEVADRWWALPSRSVVGLEQSLAAAGARIAPGFAIERAIPAGAVSAWMRHLEQAADGALDDLRDEVRLVVAGMWAMLHRRVE